VKKKLVWIIAILVACAVAAQFYQPDRTHPPADPALDLAQHTPVPREVHQLLRQACYDCHSYETIWPWYGRISPVSWFLAKDVTQGRRHLNFSLWGKYPVKRRETALGEIREQLAAGTMPLAPYVMMHSEAKLDSAARQQIIAWAKEHEAVSSDEKDDQ
jgi:hypothetical protein